MILSFSDITEFKKAIDQRFSIKIHFHDCCGGQHFTVDEMTEELKEYIASYFAERKLKVRFSEDSKHFSVEELS
ncbi:MAG: hypothetical protein IJZ93_01510 [Clostridia bacterium]|nr:hypothetical protein [Clostridia bacterium]